MRLYNTDSNTQNSRDITRSLLPVDPNTIYPFMCQTIIGSRKPCRILTKKWSELKNINTVTGGTTTTVDSSFTNKERYSHYSKNTQKYSSNVISRNAPKIDNLQSINSYANTIIIYFTATVNTYIKYYIVVTNNSNNIVVHTDNFKNTNTYSINRLKASTSYHISITATDYLGQQTIITLDKSTTAVEFDTPCEVKEPPYIPEEFTNTNYQVLGNGN
jgi:hypothetical protein